MDNFKINNRIDIGTDGIFPTGSEKRLSKRLEEMEGGKKLFNSLVERGAISLVEATTAPKADTASGGEPEGSTEELSTEEEPETTEESEETSESEPDYEPTGKFEKYNYGGSMFAIVDPDGKIIDRARGEDSADEIIEELNKQ